MGRWGDERDRGSRERGNILVLFALMLPVLMVCCAIAVDVGYWWVMAKRTQVAADACALAAAQELPHPYNDVPNCVVEAGQGDYVLVNLPDQSAPDPAPRHVSTRVRSPYRGDPNLVEATVRMHVGTFFGRYVGLGSVAVERRAVAEREPPPGQQAIYADSSDCGFSLKFNGENTEHPGRRSTRTGLGSKTARTSRPEAQRTFQAARRRTQSSPRVRRRSEQGRRRSPSRTGPSGSSGRTSPVLMETRLTDMQIRDRLRGADRHLLRRRIHDQRPPDSPERSPSSRTGSRSTTGITRSRRTSTASCSSRRPTPRRRRRTTTTSRRTTSAIRTPPWR